MGCGGDATIADDVVVVLLVREGGRSVYMVVLIVREGGASVWVVEVVIAGVLHDDDVMMVAVATSCHVCAREMSEGVSR